MEREKELREKIETLDNLKQLCEKTALKKIEIKKWRMVAFQIIIVFPLQFSFLFINLILRFQLIP